MRGKMQRAEQKKRKKKKKKKEEMLTRHLFRLGDGRRRRVCVEVRRNAMLNEQLPG
jgi:hypothetical protein